MSVTKTYFLLFGFFIFVPVSSYLNAQDGNASSSPLGFDFGVSEKDALKIIKSEDREILENQEDSKKIRTIVFEGSIVKVPLDTDENDIETRLEFFKDKLMSSALTVRSDDSLNREDTANSLYNFLSNKYGDPVHKERVLNYMTWTWRQPDMKVVYSASRDSNVLKVAYIYEPLNRTRLEKEIQDKHKGKPEDPAKEMFLDGDFSKPKHLKE